TPVRDCSGRSEFWQFSLTKMAIYGDRRPRRELASNQHPRQTARTKRHSCLIFNFSAGLATRRASRRNLRTSKTPGRPTKLFDGLERAAVLLLLEPAPVDAELLHLV